MMNQSLKTEYECKKCGRIFIAYKKDLECPSCDTPEQSDGEGYTFIDDLISSMKAHKAQYGTYKPPVWEKNGYVDYMRGIVYKCFDFAEEEPDKGIEYMLEVFRAIDPNNKDGENKHIRRVIAEVALRYNELKGISNHK
jgi:hypothetical protein